VGLREKGGGKGECRKGTGRKQESKFPATKLILFRKKKRTFERKTTGLR